MYNLRICLASYIVDERAMTWRSQSHLWPTPTEVMELQIRRHYMPLGNLRFRAWSFSCHHLVPFSKFPSTTDAYHHIRVKARINCSSAARVRSTVSKFATLWFAYYDHSLNLRNGMLIKRNFQIRNLPCTTFYSLNWFSAHLLTSQFRSKTVQFSFLSTF